MFVNEINLWGHYLLYLIIPYKGQISLNLLSNKLLLNKYAKFYTLIK